MKFKDLLDEIEDPPIYILEDPAENISSSDLSVINSILEIIDTYKDSEAISKDYILMNRDLVSLSAKLVDLSRIFSSLSVYGESLEQELSIQRSKIRLELKSQRSKTAYKSLTLEDIKDLVNVKTETAWKTYQSTKQVAEYCKSLYYTVKEFCNLLSVTLSRLQRNTGD